MDLNSDSETEEYVHSTTQTNNQHATYGTSASNVATTSHGAQRAEAAVGATVEKFRADAFVQPAVIINELPEEGVKKLAVLVPSFVADCLETLEVIAGEAGEIFEEHGGEHFAHIPCLNDTAEGMSVLKTIVERELSGWI